MSGIEQELASEGISYIGGTAPDDSTLSFTLDLSTFSKDPDVAVVLCGLDTAVNYTKLCKACERRDFAWRWGVECGFGEGFGEGTVEFGEAW